MGTVELTLENGWWKLNGKRPDAEESYIISGIKRLIFGNVDICIKASDLREAKESNKRKRKPVQVTFTTVERPQGERAAFSTIMETFDHSRVNLQTGEIS